MGLQKRWSLVGVLAAILVNSAMAGCPGDDTQCCNEEDCPSGYDFISGGDTIACDSSCDPSTTCCTPLAPTPAPDASEGNGNDEGWSPAPVTNWTSDAENSSDDDDVSASPLLTGENEADAFDGSESGDGNTAAVIALAVLLSALILGNIICCFVLKRKKRSPPPRALPGFTRDPNVDAEMGHLQSNLEAEQSRRIRAEAIIHRAQGGGGIHTGEFPSVRDVNRNVENLANYALTWTEKAAAIGGSHPALAATTTSVLENMFLVCKEEVGRCLDGRLKSLSEFLGYGEPVALVDLSEGDSMNLDTQYVLYECLRRNFQTIVRTDPDCIDELAGTIEQRCGESAVRSLASQLISGDARPSFENLLKNYMTVFVEMTLQKPSMEFEDNLGEISTFNPIFHRDWAPNSRAPAGRQCRIVFPATRVQEGRPESHAKVGVVLMSA